MREIKFRMWTGQRYIYDQNIVFDCMRQQYSGLYDHVKLHESDFEQFTGLHDKNGKGLTELYEGDILDEKGEICANIHQKYHKRTTDFIIEKMGTKKWRDTEQEAIRRGWGYAE